MRSLDDVSESTRRQRRWALNDLLAYAPSPGLALGHDLTPDRVSAWLVQAAQERGGSLASLRARASAVRALARHALETGALCAEDVAELERVLELPAPTRAHAKGSNAVGELLSYAAWERRPYGVHPDVWARFAAHIHLLSATGAAERALSRLQVADLDMLHGTVRLPDHDRPHPVGKTTIAVVRSWLERRKEIVSQLEGSDPGALWVRVRPSGDRHGDRTHQAGLPISQRGLRWAFQDTRDQLAAHHPDFAHVEIRAIRAHRQPVATTKGTEPRNGGSVPSEVG